MSHLQGAHLQGVMFGLVPVNDEARWVVEQKENRSHRVRSFGQFNNPSLAFGPRIPSETAGRLATFGRHENHDIRLPSSPPPTAAAESVGSAVAKPKASDGRNYQNYRSQHCFFFLAKSGELILRDLSPCLVHIELEDATPDEARLYALHGNPRTGPRQRVIPRTRRPLYIIIGTSTCFRFVWADGLVDSLPHTQAYLARKAQGLAVPGMTITPPARSGSHQLPALYSRELKSRHTPSVPSKEGPRKLCHKYAKLGSGGFGVVYKSVDLSSGELWAVKEIRAEAPKGGERASIDRLKTSLIREVEIMAKISHAHIVHYETYQDFRVGGSFQIFYKLYEGNLLSLIPDSAGKPPPPPASWMPRMVTQMATAIEYLHMKKIVHMDIKPQNILFDHTAGSAQPNFYLGDFGLAMAEAEAHGTRWAGTLFYMAPEMRCLLAPPSPASDIWSFAMTVGMALGFWCPNDLESDAAQWAKKLRMLGVKFSYTETPELADPRRHHEAFYHRIATAVVSGVLPPMFSKLLLDQEDRSTAVGCKHTDVDFFIKRPSNPEPITDWAGAKTPWLRNFALQSNVHVSVPPPPVPVRGLQQRGVRPPQNPPQVKPSQIPQPARQRQTSSQQQSSSSSEEIKKNTSRTSSASANTVLPFQKGKGGSRLPLRQQPQNPPATQQHNNGRDGTPKPLLQASSSNKPPPPPQQQQQQQPGRKPRVLPQPSRIPPPPSSQKQQPSSEPASGVLLQQTRIPPLRPAPQQHQQQQQQQQHHQPQQQSRIPPPPPPQQQKQPKQQTTQKPAPSAQQSRIPQPSKQQQQQQQQQHHQQNQTNPFRRQTQNKQHETKETQKQPRQRQQEQRSTSGGGGGGGSSTSGGGNPAPAARSQGPSRSIVRVAMHEDGMYRDSRGGVIRFDS